MCLRLNDIEYMSWLKKILSKKEIHSYYLTICCIAKDEDDYLSEWINFHLKAGVDYFYIYDNGSKVPIKTIISEAGLSAYVKVIEMPGKSKQVKAYKNCLRRFGKTSKWIAFIDLDEFILAKSTKGNLPLFLKAYEPYGALAVNWQMFGSAYHLKRTNRPQLESFTLKAEENYYKNTHVKSIVQPKYVKDKGNAHFFKFIDGYFAVNENFNIVEGSFSNVSVNKIQINHYYCRSLEEYKEKVIRGIADTKRPRQMDEFYEHDRDSNALEDKTILGLFS